MDTGTSDVVAELTLPSDPKYLSLVRVVVGAAASALPSLSDTRIADLKLVVTELFTNAMEANWRTAVARGADPADARPAGSPPVRVTCRATPSGVTVTVGDEGPGLGALDGPHPPVEDPDRLDHERGLGLPLIQYLADEVDYESGHDGTTAVAVLSDRGDRAVAP